MTRVTPAPSPMAGTMRMPVRRAKASRTGEGRAGVPEEMTVLRQCVLDRRTPVKAEPGYVKTSGGLEVDFLARHLAGGEELVQVCADPSAPETLGRELRALREAAEEHPRAARRFLVLDRDQALRAKAPGVEVRPAYEWLLAGSEG